MSTANNTLATVGQGGFGSFIFMCRDATSYSPCNLFYKQLSKTNFTLDDPETAPVGITPTCGIPLAVRGRLGNVANVVACGLCFLFMIYLSQRTRRRRAAVGRIEIHGMLLVYAASLIVQALANGSLIEQGTIALVIVTILHAALTTTFFWLLIANGLVATQVVEDGTPSSLIPYYGFSGIFFLVTAYIAADTAFGFTSLFKSNPPQDLRNVGLFILLVMWPVAASIIYVVLMGFIVIRVLGEKKPFIWYLLAFALFVASQVAFLFIGRPLCQASNRFLDSAFIATILETASVGLLFLGWRAITESDWESDQVFLV